jgi:predicted regulator of Ras-like GTPase activity (Roadblock/LC7/MglB family)
MADAQTALAELTEISSQVQAAVLFDRKGAVEATTLSGDRGNELASMAQALLEAAEGVREGELTQLEAATGEGSLFVVHEGERLIAAVTSAEPTAGLVFYDLKSCLRRAAEKPKPKPKRRTRAKASGST